MKEHKFRRRIIFYLIIIVLITGLYKISPFIWKIISSSKFLNENIVMPVKTLVLPLMGYAIERGMDPIQFLKSIFLGVGFLVTVIFCLLTMREFERIIEKFKEDILAE